MHKQKIDKKKISYNYLRTCKDAMVKEILLINGAQSAMFCDAERLISGETNIKDPGYTKSEVVSANNPDLETSSESPLGLITKICCVDAISVTPPLREI
jgi:hypothetical protein